MHFESKAPVMICMLLRQGIMWTVRQNFSASGNVSETDIICLYDLVKLITSDRSKIWNSVEVHEAYRS